MANQGSGASSGAATGMAAAIEDRLRAALAPQRLAIIDDSHLHVGHAGARPEGESHFRVEIVSAAFAGKSRLARQRLVYRALAAELSGGLHALSLRTLTPAEDGAAAPPGSTQAPV